MHVLRRHILRSGGESLRYTALLALVIAGGTNTAHAEGDTNVAADTQIESVTVTARRREEAVQDVPLAISVLNANTIESTGTLNVGRLTQLQPSAQFYSSNPRNSSVNIRGLGTPFGLTNDGIEPGVGIYIDQVYYSRNATATFDFLCGRRTTSA